MPQQDEQTGHAQAPNGVPLVEPPAPDAEANAARQTPTDRAIEQVSTRLAGMRKTTVHDGLQYDITKHSDGGRILVIIDPTVMEANIHLLSKDVAAAMAEKMRVSDIIIGKAGDQSKLIRPGG